MFGYLALGHISFGDDGPLLAPVITSSATANNTEGLALFHSLTGEGFPTWSIIGGADQNDFEISGSTLRWVGNTTRDYEDPDDTGLNNTYVVDIRATNSVGTTDQTVTITVTNVAETGISVAEDQPLAYVLGTGLTSAVIQGGRDAADFEVIESGADHILQWFNNGTKDFETPDDTGLNNVYDVEVALDDGLDVTIIPYSVTVTDVTEGGAQPWSFATILE